LSRDETMDFSDEFSLAHGMEDDEFGVDLAQLLDAAIAEADGDFDHLAMWAEGLEDAAMEGVFAAEEQSVVSAMGQDAAVQQAVQQAGQQAGQQADAAGLALQVMVDFLQDTLGLAAPLARTESPEEGGKVRSRFESEGLTAADRRELFP